MHGLATRYERGQRSEAGSISLVYVFVVWAFLTTSFEEGSHRQALQYPGRTHCVGCRAQVGRVAVRASRGNWPFMLSSNPKGNAQGRPDRYTFTSLDHLDVDWTPPFLASFMRISPAVCR